MNFSEQSDVTVVITCCGRIDLLQQTLNTFFKFNSYPIKKIIITEDAGCEEVYSVIPQGYEAFFTIIVNSVNIGQIRSIDKAYALVDTEYVFHCEEDWDFYRAGFIEDSKAILAANHQVYQVRLRSFYHDIARDYPFHSLGQVVKSGHVVAHRLMSSNDQWQGFSFNPGLIRLSDYQKIKGGYASFLKDATYAINVESDLSVYVSQQDRFTVILENDAVAHIGYDRHVANRKEKRKKIKKQAAILAAVIVVFSLGWLVAKI